MHRRIGIIKDLSCAAYHAFIATQLLLVVKQKYVFLKEIQQQEIFIAQNSTQVFLPSIIR